MTAIGEAEKKTQLRVVQLFIDKLHYAYLGELSDGDNQNIREGELEQFLFAYQGYAEREDGEALMGRAVAEVVKVAGNTSLSLYDRNKAVYDLLRYGVPVKAKDPKAHSKRPDLVIYVNGIALGVLELKRSKVSVAEGIRQNLDIRHHRDAREILPDVERGRSRG